MASVVKYAAVCPMLDAHERQALQRLLEAINTAKVGAIIQVPSSLARQWRNNDIQLVHADGRRTK